MVRATARGATLERLVRHLFDDPEDQVALEVAAWLAGSTRFRAFADTNRDKIRKKLRGATDAETRLDVRAELRAAHLLLADRRIELAFEAYGSTKGGPDFTVSFRGERPFNVEVTRLRGVPGVAAYRGQLLAKLRQLPPSVPNLVLIAIDGADADGSAVSAAARELRGRADAKDESFFTSRGFDGTRGFYHRYLRLGAVQVWSERAAGDARAVLWHNRSARIALPEPAARAALRCLRAAQLPSTSGS